MGCGSSKANMSNVQKGKADLSANDLSKLAPGNGDGAVLHLRADSGEGNLLLQEYDNRELDVKVETAKPAKGAMDVQEDKHVDEDDIIDHNRTSISCISDIISMDIKKGSEKHSLLKDISVEMFVEEGKKLITKINDMPLNLEDMPKNFSLARKLRLVYHNARYNVGVQFCKLYLDKIMDEGLFSCLTKALQSLQEKWPEVFSASNLQEVTF